MSPAVEDFLVYIIELCAERYFSGSKTIAYNQLKNTDQLAHAIFGIYFRRNQRKIYGMRDYCMILYHGSLEIIKEPDPFIGRKNVDFGQGFYLTDLQEQAIRWQFIKYEEFQ